jgi:hypothetical protein
MPWIGWQIVGRGFGRAPEKENIYNRFDTISGSTGIETIEQIRTTIHTGKAK